MHSKSQSVRVGPESVLTRSGLLVHGLPQVLPHSSSLADLVCNTLGIVSEVLTLVFPKPRAIPTPDGAARPSNESAAENYARNAAQLKAAAPGSEGLVAGGCAVLQWCGATVAAVNGSGLQVREMPGFIVIDYLARHGADALACSPEQWDAHLAWLFRGQTLETFWARVEGVAEGDPRPPAVPIAVPRPEDLGADLGIRNSSAPT